MKLPVLPAATITCLAVVSAALANGPGMMEPAPGNTTSTNSNQNDPQRQRWVRHRLEQLEKNREHYENEKVRAGMLMTPFGGQPSDFVEVAKFKMWEADTKPQRQREKVETLMLKREKGTITPAENSALNKWLRQHTRHRSQ